MSISIILSMAGGLGLFLYGMRIMSDSIEKVAGAKLRGILERLTTNRFMAILVGVFFTAVVEVIKELDRMGSLANENLNRAMNALITLDQDEINEVYEVEKNIDFLSHAITNYLVKINQTTLPIEDLKSIGALFHVVNDIERIGDHAENIVDAAVQREKTGVGFSKAAQRELGEMIDMVNTVLRFSFEMFVKSTEEHVEDIRNLEEAIDEKEKELQQRHIERLSNNECTPEAGAMFSDIVSGLERVADHATNIAFANSYFEPN